jgi:hypothetical protein
VSHTSGAIASPLPFSQRHLSGDMAAIQQLSMQSRTGRVNQRKCAHETPQFPSSPRVPPSSSPTPLSF